MGVRVVILLYREGGREGGSRECKGGREGGKEVKDIEVKDGDVKDRAGEGLSE